MSGFSGWVLSIVGMCVLSVLIELILPEGQTRKYINAIYSFFLIVVIIAPLPKLVRGDFDFEKIITTEEVELQEDFIYQMNRNKLDTLSDEIENELKERGVEGVQVMISADIFSNNLVIEAVFVDLFDLVIRDESQHINTHEIIVEVVQKFVDVEKENIVFNE